MREYFKRTQKSKMKIKVKDGVLAAVVTQIEICIDHPGILFPVYKSNFHHIQSVKYADLNDSAFKRYSWLFFSIRVRFEIKKIKNGK